MMLKYPNLKNSPTKMGLLCHYLALEPVEKKRKKLLEKYLGDVCRFPTKAPALAQEPAESQENRNGVV